MGSTLTDLHAVMTWEHGKCLAWYSPQSHFWDCNITLKLEGGVGVWNGDWVFVKKMCDCVCQIHFYNVCIWFLLTVIHCLIDDFGILWAGVDHCLSLASTSKELCSLEVRLLNQGWHWQMFVFFNMELTDSDKFVVICPQRFPSSKHCTQQFLGTWSSHLVALGLFARISPRCRQYIFFMYV